MQERLSFGDFTLDPGDERLLGPQGPVRLGNKAYRVLLELAHHFTLAAPPCRSLTLRDVPAATS